MFLSSVFNLFHHLEERLYWVLNHSYHHGQPRHPVMRPNKAAEVRVPSGINSILTRLQLAMAHKRQKRAESIDTSYASEGDVFRVNANYMKKGYTKQVPAPPIHGQFAAMQHQVHQGQIEVDTMILLDVSSSMGWDHTGFDQPRHVGVSGYLNIHVCCSDNCYRCRT